MFASSPLSRVGADECRPMTFENGGICQKMRRYHLFLPRSNVAGSTAIPLTLGLARPSYPRSVHSEVEGILAYYPCLCVMRYHDYAETNNAPIFPCECQRLDIISTADMSVRELPLCTSKAGHYCLHRRECVGTPPVHVKGWT